METILSSAVSVIRAMVVKQKNSITQVPQSSPDWVGITVCNILTDLYCFESVRVDPSWLKIVGVVSGVVMSVVMIRNTTKRRTYEWTKNDPDSIVLGPLWLVTACALKMVSIIGIFGRR